LTIGVLGFGVFAAAWLGYIESNHTLFLWLAMAGMGAGILIYTYGTYAGHPKGIKNNNVMFNSLTSRGVLGWISGVVLTLFYIQIYWFPETLEGMIRLFDPLAYLLTGSAAGQWFVYGTIYTFLILFLGIKFIVKYRHNRYQVIRTISVVFFQVVFAYAIPHILEAFNDYQGYFAKDLKNVWPLNYGFTESYQMDAMQNNGVTGTFYFVWGLILFLIVTPFLTYFVGKRWYCSWVCGCGGLAETAGDGFRQLSSKKMSSWKLERWVVHLVMVFVLVMTVASLWPYFSGKDYELGFLTITGEGFFYTFITLLSVTALGLGILAYKRKHNILLIGSVLMLAIVGFLIWVFTNEEKNVFTMKSMTESSVYYSYLALMIVVAIGLFLIWRKRKNVLLLVGSIAIILIAGLLTWSYLEGAEEVFSFKSKSIKRVYGFLIGAAFAGVIGVGFYPLLGNRVWCRFGCPMAGYMGLFQRFKSRFRITTNGAQCISCGNCSTYCEQGIDVRAYAQKGENIVRASCVGCGVCSAVCPRGVLKLENGPEEGRFEPNPIEVTKDGIKLNV
jgi:polyferredoxin